MRKYILTFLIAIALVAGCSSLWAATLTDTPEYTANEIYEISASDQVEGAAVGASFGGIGLSNEQGQQLANRTAFLYGRQNTDIANIAALQVFQALFTGSMGQNGYLDLGYNDIHKGQSVAMIEWGVYALDDVKIPNDIQYSVSWPTAFPHACFVVLATNIYASTSGFNTAASVISYSTTGATFVLDVPGGTSLGTTGERSNGIGWLAIGY